MTDIGTALAHPASRTAVAAMALVMSASLAAQAPDLSKLGPQVGATVPPVSGIDQFGKPQTLASAAGSKGTMLVFFRSADW
ncbi:MAG TPA: hypothetical protein VJ691_13705 [Vicinamibacterales bacterium]|nr:hypothetical protein [Vicinamibacterales bacterium]